jgi:hypothetical protein
MIAAKHKSQQLGQHQAAIRKGQSDEKIDAPFGFNLHGVNISIKKDRVNTTI